MRLFGILLFAVSFIQCASTKFSQEPPFTITNATYNDWVGGVQGVSGKNVILYYKTAKNIVFDEIFFDGKRAKAELKSNKNGTMLVGNFTSSNRKKFDIQLHSDPKKEYGNKPIEKEVKIPFKLKKNEAIISYKENGELKYYKVENIQKGKTVYYP